MKLGVLDTVKPKCTENVIELVHKGHTLVLLSFYVIWYIIGTQTVVWTTEFFVQSLFSQY